MFFSVSMEFGIIGPLLGPWAPLFLSSCFQSCVKFGIMGPFLGPGPLCIFPESFHTYMKFGTMCLCACTTFVDILVFMIGSRPSNNILGGVVTV